MYARHRKLSLTTHIISSVGWLGAVTVFLAFAVVGITSSDAKVVRGTYIVMDVTAWVVLVPLSLASLVTGLMQSLGTRWGLLRHYWVLAKLGINLIATVVLLMYTETLSGFARIARAPAGAAGTEALKDPSPVVHGALALVLLVVATVLSVYKPRGMTPYGRRKAALV
jgi:hypothetical protein